MQYRTFGLQVAQYEACGLQVIQYKNFRLQAIQYETVGFRAPQCKTFWFQDIQYEAGWPQGVQYEREVGPNQPLYDLMWGRVIILMSRPVRNLHENPFERDRFGHFYVQVCVGTHDPKRRVLFPTK